MSERNLNELAGGDSFKLTLDGFVYNMAYPSSEDVLKLSETTGETAAYQEQLAKLKAEPKTPETEEQIRELEGKVTASGQSMLDWCMTYIKPELATAPDFKEALLKKSIKYLLAFMDAVKTELGS